MASLRKLLVTRSYPVKGLMGFVRWMWTHTACAQSAPQEVGR